MATTLALGGVVYGVKSIFIPNNKIIAVAEGTTTWSKKDILYIQDKIEPEWRYLQTDEITKIKEEFLATFYDEDEPVQDLNEQLLAYLIKKGYVLPENLFDDVKKNYYYDALVWAYTNKYISANSVYKFGIGDELKRGEVVNILYHYLLDNGEVSDEIIENSKQFNDIPKGDKMYIPVSALSGKGILEGDKNGNANLSTSITRAQFIAMLWRMAGKPSSSQEISFKDVDASAYYYEAIKWAVERGIVKGTTDITFDPNGSLKKQHFVTLLYRYDIAKNRPIKDDEKSENEPKKEDTTVEPEEPTTTNTTLYEQLFCEEKYYCQSGEANNSGQCVEKTSVNPVLSSDGSILTMSPRIRMVYDIQNNKTVGAVKLFECDIDNYKYNPVSGQCEMPSKCPDSSYTFNSSTGQCEKETVISSGLSELNCQIKWTTNRNEPGWTFTGKTKVE